MAHYALLNLQNVVIDIITGVDENISQIDVDGTQVGGSTEAWENFYQTRPWFEGLRCKRTSYNARGGGYRKNYAGIGYTYDENRDAFIPQQCHPDCLLDESTCLWDCVHLAPKS